MARVQRVIVLPRGDGTIGRGTLRDLELAQRAGRRVGVVTPEGKVAPIDQADLEPTGKVGDYEVARFTWPTADLHPRR
jgi:hypothetical protein